MKKNRRDEGRARKSSKAPRPAGRAKSLYLPLEQRLMFDAAAAATTAEVASEQVAQEQAEAALSADAEERGPGTGPTGSEDLVQALTTFLPTDSPSEVAFVDPTVPNYQELLSGLDPNIEVIMLDGGSDGIEQIANALAGRAGIDAIHFISHGDQGRLHLGTGTLTQESMTGRYAGELATIQHALSEQADLLVYGCNFAEGDVGQAAVALLGQLTGADVAASSDLTGAADLGGDWMLEVTTGSIESRIAITGEAQAAYSGVLDIVSDLTAQYGFEEDSGTTATDTSGNNRNGTLVGSPTWTSGQVGTGALNFGGDFDRVEVSDALAPNFGNGDFSVALWLNSTQTSAGQSRLVGDYSSGANGFLLYRNNTDVVLLVQGTTGSATLTAAGLFDGNWHQVTAVRNGSTFELYADGILSASTTATVGDIDTTSTLRVGASSGTTGDYDGRIDDVRFYSRALSSGDVGQLYATGNDAPINTVPGGQSTNEDTNLVFSSGNGNQISIADPDSSGASFEITISVTNGTLSLSGSTGLTFTTGDGTTDSTMTFRGTVTDINSALNGLSYIPTADYNGSSTLTVTTRDSTLVSLDIDANLQARYTFEGNANDVASGTAQNGTLTNGASIVRDGTRGQVLNLDGGNDFVDLSSSTADFSSFTEGTISGWIKVTGRYETIFSISDTADTGSYAALFLGASGYLTYEVMENGVMQLAVYKSDITINDGNWHHVAVSIGPSGNLLYVDGVAATAGQLTYDTGNASTQRFFSNVSNLDSMTIGRNQDSSGGKWYATGRLDDVRVYDRVLSASEVSSLAGDLNLTDTDTVAITVNAVNDAPVLDNSGTMTFTSISEDDTNNSGQTVASIISSAGGDRITDADSGASEGIAITSLSSGSGTWQYNTGSGWINIGTVSESSALLLRATDSIRFVPDGEGADSGSIGFRAWDQTSGTAGTKVTTGAAATITDQFNSTSYSNNNGTQNWAGGWVETDAGGSGPSSGSIQISSNQLRFDADTVGDNIAREVDLSSATGATLSFSYNNSLSGADRVEVRVSSDGGANYTTLTNGTFSGSLRTGSGSASFDIVGYAASNTRIQFIVTGTGGNDRFYVDNVQIATTAISATGAFSASTETASITVTAANDAPVNTVPGAQTVNEDTPLALGGISVTDADDNLSTVQLSVDFGRVTVTLSGSATITAGANSGPTLTLSGTQADINATLATLVYQGPANYSGSATLTVQSTDANSATDTDAVAITVNPVNDAPVLDLDADNSSGATGADYQVTFTENGGAVSIIDVADASLIDVEGGSLAGLTVTLSNPLDGISEVLTATTSGTSIVAVYDSGTGVLTLSGSDSVANYQQVLRTIQYNNTSEAPSLTNRVLYVVAEDGTDYSNTATVTVGMVGVNDAPVLADTALTLTVAEDAGAPSGTVGNLLSAFTGGITDADSGASKGIAITGTDETNGTWYYTTDGGSTWTAVGSVSNTSALLLADNGSTRLYFAPSADYNGTSTAALTLRAWDQTNGTAGTKVTTASNGGTTAFSSATDTIDVTVSAVNDTPTDLSLSAGTVAENAGNGTVVGTVSGTDPDTGDTKTYSLTDTAGGRFAINSSTGQITVADGSLLNYEVAASHNVTVRVTDSGGLTYDETFTITVTNENEAPTGADATITLAEDTTHTLTTANFGFSDVDAGDSLSAVRIDTVPSAGTLNLSGVNVTAGQVIALADITSGKLMFRPATDANGTGYTSFTFSVRDSTSTYDSAPNVLTINVTAVNDAPVMATNDGLTVSEAGSVVVSPKFLSVTDVDNRASELTFMVTTLPVNGTLLLNRVPLSLKDTFTQADIDREMLEYVHDGSETTVDSFAFVVEDGSGGAIAESTFKISITPINDTPTDLSLSANTVTENASNGTVVGTITGTDPDTGDTKTYSFTDSAGGRFAIQSSTGVITVADGSLLDYESATSHNVTVRVTDSGGLTYDETFTINLTNVNEGPTFSNLNGAPTYVEGGAAVVLDSDVQITDPELSSSNNFSGATLTLQRQGGANSQDIFSAAGTLSPLIDEGALVVNGITIGGVLQNAGGTLILVFNGNATGALVNAAMQQIAYSNSSDAPPNSAQVNWTFSDGNSGTQGTGGALGATGSTTVTITAVNDTPTDLSLSAGTVAENAGNGTVVGTVSGTDPDTGDTKTYSLTDTAGGRFAINSSTGQITVADGSLLNYEIATSHNVTVRVTDSGGLTYDETFTITVTNENEAPTGADATITLAEDTTHTLTTANFGFSDVDAGDSLSAVRIDTVPSAGSLTLSGVAVTAGQVITVADITAGNLVFTPAADATGTAYASVTFSVRDSASSYDAAPNMLTFDVTPVNDAPVLTREASLDFESYVPGNLGTQDGWSIELFNTSNQVQVTAGAGPDGGTALQFPYSGSGVANALSKVGETALPDLVSADSLTLQWSMRNSFWGNTFALAHDANGDGQILTSSGETAIGVYSSQSTNSLQMLLPNGTSITVAMPATFGADEWIEFRWQMDLTANGGQGVGTLEYRNLSDGETTWNSNASFTNVNLGLNPLAVDKTNPATWDGIYLYLEGSLSGFDNYTATVNADSGSAMFTENGAPVVLDSNVTIADMELTAANNFSGATLMLSRNGGANGQDVFSATGTLSSISAASGNVVVGGTTIGTYTNSGGTLVMTFNSSATNTLVNSAMQQLAYNNSSDAPPSSVQIDWNFNDSNDGSQGTGGALTATASTMVYITPANDTPTDLSLSANSVTENASNGTVVGTITGTDPDTGDTKTYSFTDSAGGRFAIQSSTGVITVADGSLLDHESATSHNVTVRVTDSGGLTYDETFTITVTNMNEAPTGADATITLAEDTTHTLTTANFGFSDVDAGDSLSAVRIDTVPSAGSLTLSGVAVTAGQVITVSDLMAGQLVFTPAADATGTGYASVTFSVRDSASSYDAAPNTLTFDVTPVNDAPVNTVPGAQTVNEDTALALSGLSVADVDGNLSTVQLGVGNGTLSVTLQGTATISAGSSGTGSLTLAGSQTDLNATLATLIYQGSAHFNGSDTLTVTSTDSNSLTDVDTVAITVMPQNDAPTLSANTGSTAAEGGTDTITASELAVTDVDNSAAQLTYSIGTGPTYGRLELTTAPGISATTFTQADIAANRLVYVHDGSESTGDTFTFTVSDGAGGSLGATSVTLTITPVNDAPTIVSNGGGAMAAINVAEHVSAVTIAGAVDVDLPAQSLTYSVSGGIDQARFTIDAVTGALEFSVPPDFEVPTDADGDHVYVVEVRVTDSQGATATQTLHVTVTDVYESSPPAALPPSLVPTPPPAVSTPTPVAAPPVPDATAPVMKPVAPDARVSSGESGVRPAQQSSGSGAFRPDELRSNAAVTQRENSEGRAIDQSPTGFLTFSVEDTHIEERETPLSPAVLSELLFAKLDAVIEELEEAVAADVAEQVHVTRIAAATGVTLSVGFVAWALRSTVLLASLFGTLPAWQTIDPLPVLASHRSERTKRKRAQENAARAEQVEYRGLHKIFDWKEGRLPGSGEA